MALRVTSTVAARLGAAGCSRGIRTSTRGTALGRVHSGAAPLQAVASLPWRSGTVVGTTAGAMVCASVPRSTRGIFMCNVNLPDGVQHAKEALRNADAVCFDVDSTVTQDEGIDELALAHGEEVYQAVKAVTDAAMKGNPMPFEVAIEKRLAILRDAGMSLATVRKHMADKPSTLSPGIKELIKVLQDRGTHVYLVSGGFTILIEPVAKAVGVSMDNVYANVLRFEDTGEGKFIDHDPEQPTSRSRGKPKVIAQLKDKHGYKTTVMVGDGGTDKEARPPADAFIGYGGKVRRTGIAEGADWFVWDFGEMIDVLE